MAAAANNIGRNLLHIPNEDTRWEHAEHLQPNDFPIAGLDPDAYPFSPPVLFGINPQDPATWNQRYTADPIMFAARPLALAPHATKPLLPGTKTASTTNNLQVKNLVKGGKDRLQKVYRSVEMWDRSVQYILGRGQKRIAHPDPTIYSIGDRSLCNMPANMPPLENDPPPLNINAWDDNNVPLSEPGVAAQGIFAMHALWCTQMRSPVPIVNSEPAVQDQFIAQYLTAVDLWLQVRPNIILFFQSFSKAELPFIPL